MKSLEALEKKYPELSDQVRKIYKRIENLKSELDRRLRSQVIVNLQLSNRLEKIERKAKNE